MTWLLPNDSFLYNLSLDWRVPVGSSLIYSVIVAYWSRLNRNKGLTNSPVKGKKRSEPWTAFRIAVVAHNVLLTLFSAFTFHNTAPLVAASFRYRPFLDAFCDKGGWVFKHGIGFWAWAFYMSKYYELIDTFILLIKGKQSSFLQTFHHAGAMMTMWMIISTRAFAVWIFVVFNSFIHTVMYTYYTLTCFGYQPSWKKLMTYLQLTQFFVGLSIAGLYITIPGCIDCKMHEKNTFAKVVGLDAYWSQVIALVCTTFYVGYLIVLFMDFARRAYGGPESNTIKKRTD